MASASAPSPVRRRRPQQRPAWRRRLYLRLSLPSYDVPFALSLLLLESALCALIVRKVAYTEIDWVAYMQEVEGWLLRGEHDYAELRGDTGPLVYPAGFLYLYAGLRRVAGGDGADVRRAQWAFAALYVANAGAVLALYTLVVRERRRRRAPAAKSPGGDASGSAEEEAAANAVWSLRIAMALLCLSKRVHSIFVLRLFNDAPAMLLFYVSALLFARDRWRAGCAFFSLAVSIKMNVLLFAPGLLLLLLQSGPDFVETAVRLGICAGIQLVLGAPFLLRHPVSYIRKAFEFDRVFFYKWTVNLKFLPEETFVSKRVSLLLLLLHLSALALLAAKWLSSAESQTGGRRRLFLLEYDDDDDDAPGSRRGGRDEEGRRRRRRRRRLSAEYVLHTLFASNFAGIAFARTLHYQFYAWYFHSLPLLLWSSRRGAAAVLLPLPLRVLVLGTVEYAFNVFPATPASSAALQLAHGAVLAGVVAGEVPGMFVADDGGEGTEDGGGEEGTGGGKTD